MALQCYYRKFFGLIIVLFMINTNLIQSASVPNACLNYCSHGGGACYMSKDGPKCICSSKWTGERCDIAQNPALIEEANGTRVRMIQQRADPCAILPADFCKNQGICYLDATADEYACYCKYPYAGPYCDEISQCEGFCKNDAPCETDATGEPKCTCPLEFTGVRCGTLIPVSTTVPPSTTVVPSEVCTRLDKAGYCNSGTCVEVDGKPQCKCPSTSTGSRCENSEGGSSGGPSSVTPSPGTGSPGTGLPGTGTTIQGITCAQAPCKNGVCYPKGNSYFCLCNSGYAGTNCDNSG